MVDKRKSLLFYFVLCPLDLCGHSMVCDSFQLRSKHHFIHQFEDLFIGLDIKNRFLRLAAYRAAPCIDWMATVHTVSFDWFLSGLGWILNLEFCLLKLLIFYQNFLWNIRSRLNSSIFWVFEPLFRYVLIKIEAFCTKNEDWYKW